MKQSKHYTETFDWKNVAIFAIFVLFLSAFLTAALFESTHPFIVGGFLAAEVLLFFGLLSLFEKIEVQPLRVQFYSIVFSAIVGAGATYFLANNMKLGTVIAASFVGVTAAYLLPKLKLPNFPNFSDLAGPVYCGAFVGMTSPLIFANRGIFPILLAGTIAGIVYGRAQNLYVGVGGKMGTMAFIGTATAAFLFSILGLR